MSTAAKAMSHREARAIATAIVEALAPHCERIQIAGSIRRGKNWINDIEIVCIPKRIEIKAPELVTTDLFGTETRKKLGKDEVRQTPEFVVAWEALCDPINPETEKAKGVPAMGRYVQAFTRKEGVKVDLFMCRPENWGYIYLIRTGSVDFSKMIATRWTQLQYKGVDGMLTRFGAPVEFREEDELFAALGMTVPPPHEREMTVHGIANWIKH